MSSAASSMGTARQIRAIEQDFARRANAMDAAGMTEQYYTEDAQLLPPNMPPVRGKAAIREFWKAFMAPGVSDVKIESDEIVDGGELVYAIGRYEGIRGGRHESGKYLVVYRRQEDGSYKSCADSFSPNE